MSIIDYSWDFTKEEFSLDLDFFNEKEQEDKLWQARTGLNMDTLCGAIETIIFMSDKPINLLKIKNQIDNDLPLRVVHESIARLQAEYEAKHHGIRLMEVAQGYQFRTKATYSKIVQGMFKVSSLQLSPTALEVLAIIAYKQPISKNSVESVRGVDSSHIIRALMDRRLVRICGRSEEVGRPSLYGTTPEFLEVFNLNDVNELPSEIELEEIATANEIGEISDIKTIVNTGDKKRFDLDELEELDALSSSIKEIASETFFTKSLTDLDKKRSSEEGVEKKSAFDILEEHLNLAQVIEANKTSVESEVLTSVMEPKSVAASMLNELLNVPQEEDELEIEVELEGELDASSSEFEELNSDGVKEIEAQADEILAKSESLIQDIVENNADLVEAQTKDLEVEIDEAFDQLLAEANDNGEEVEFDVVAEVKEEPAPAPVAETVTPTVAAPSVSNDLDIASFIAGKIAAAEAVEEAKTEDVVSDEAEDEAAQLADALDEAFANLTGESLDDATDSDNALEALDELTEQISADAKDLDIDLDFLGQSLDSSENDIDSQNCLEE